MKTNNKPQTYNNFVKKNLLDIAYRSNNFNDIPPIIGIIMADQYGNTIIVLENESINGSKYGSIKSYLSEDDKNLFEIDLISMYFSSFKSFAGQTNIQNLSNLEIHGSNIKVQIYFLFDKYMIIVFLNSHTDLNSKEKINIIKYFEEKLIKYDFEFNHFNATNSREILGIIESMGKKWLRKLNMNYIHKYKRAYSKKHEFIEKLMDDIGPVIQSELFEYLESLPDETLNNLFKEINNKIQDKLFENSDLF